MKPEPAAPVTESPAERIQMALLHFEITLRTYSAGLPVDWSYACYQMARALTGDEGDAGDVDALGEPLELELATRRVLRRRGGGR